MSSNRISRHASPQLDMNPMVDMAFLLVTFFLMASTFKTAEAARVVVPRSVTTSNLPDERLITISIAIDGRTFIGLSSPEARKMWLDRYAALYDLDFDEAHRNTFSLIPGFGVPRERLKELLSMPPHERSRFTQPGLPMDSLSNELADWLVLGRTVVPRARVAIKADRGTPYKHVDHVIQTLTENNILRFNLVTDIKRLDDDRR
ncbi:MAG: biopolymer transporter ExbD [Saprospiraceae bacterium]|nr:biopolymer transporter ExbD [Saprospiraceae bacterium]